MQTLVDAAYVSFEGDLSRTSLFQLPEASTTETEPLRRNTSWPEQQFVVLPLSSDRIDPIISALGGTIPKSILHVQIAVAGRLEAGIYDGDIGAFFDTPISSALLKQALSNGSVIRDES
jgi:hypothetical protein